MSEILRPGYVRWDGTKYVLDPGVEIIGPPGPPGAPGADGKSGVTSVIFRPGVATSAPAYATWAEVVAAAVALANGVSSPVSIIFEDATAACVIPAGTWNFGSNVAFVGMAFDAGGVTIVQINDGCIFTNSPVTFRDIEITFSGNTPVITQPPFTTSNSAVSCYNAFFSANGTAPFCSYTARVNFSLYSGSTIFNTGTPVIKMDGDDLIIYLLDGAVVQDNSVLGSGAALTNLFLIIYSSNTIPSNVQTGFSAIVNQPLSIDPLGSLSSGPTSGRPIVTIVGSRYFDTTLGTLVVWNGTAWITLGATTLNGDVTGPTGNTSVVAISGDGNVVDILCPITTFNAPGQPYYHPQTIQSSFLNTPTSFSQNIYNLPNSSGVQIDVIATALHDSSGDYASWKISFAAYSNSGGSTVAVGANPNPLGVLPDRATAGASGWLYTLVLSGASVNSQGTAASNTKWGITYQIVPLWGP